MTTSALSLGGGDGPLMLVLLAVAGLASALLLGLGFAAFARRRSRAYLLVVLALAALLARTVVAVGAEAGVLSHSAHHVAEHGLDVAMAALVVGAVVYARRVDPGREQERTRDPDPDAGVDVDASRVDRVDAAEGDRS